MPQVRRARPEWLISVTEAVRLVGLGLSVTGQSGLSPHTRHRHSEAAALCEGADFAKPVYLNCLESDHAAPLQFKADGCVNVARHRHGLYTLLICGLRLGSLRFFS